jgi:hypothetical protein
MPLVGEWQRYRSRGVSRDALAHVVSAGKIHDDQPASFR